MVVSANSVILSPPRRAKDPRQYFRRKCRLEGLWPMLVEFVGGRPYDRQLRRKDRGRSFGQQLAGRSALLGADGLLAILGAKDEFHSIGNFARWLVIIANVHFGKQSQRQQFRPGDDQDRGKYDERPVHVQHVPMWVQDLFNRQPHSDASAG